MEKIAVFSRKTNSIISPFASNILMAESNNDSWSNGSGSWNNNSYESWVDNGWNNNSHETWQNKGWNNNSHETWKNTGWNNNSYETWEDKGWNNNSYGSWTDSGSSGGGCFITTACVEYHGLTDNCHQLQVLRSVRDHLVSKNEEVREMILEYYRKAPLIVKAIDASSDKAEIYSDLYVNLVEKCVLLAEQDKMDEAVSTYIDVYKKLERAYL